MFRHAMMEYATPSVGFHGYLVRLVKCSPPPGMGHPVINSELNSPLQEEHLRITRPAAVVIWQKCQTITQRPLALYGDFRLYSVITMSDNRYSVYSIPRNARLPANQL